MKRDRNHEGYHDPTAGAAIRKADRGPGRKNGGGALITLGELPVFQRAVKEMKR